jgi:hypothetical protein
MLIKYVKSVGRKVAVNVERSGFAMDPSARALVLSDSVPLKLLVEPFGQMERVGNEALLPFADSFFRFEEGGAFNDDLTGDVAEIVAPR